jgi:hypothetical protein
MLLGSGTSPARTAQAKNPLSVPRAFCRPLLNMNSHAPLLLGAKFVSDLRTDSGRSALIGNRT